MIQNDGSVKGAKSSITNSKGNDLLVETTSLAATLWVKALGYLNSAKLIDKADEFISNNINPKKRVSTQAIVLALNFKSLI